MSGKLNPVEIDREAERLCEVHASAHKDDDGVGIMWPALEEWERDQWRAVVVYLRARQVVARLEDIRAEEARLSDELFVLQEATEAGRKALEAGRG